MSDLWECEICKSLIKKEQLDGQCKICKIRTCPNCRRVCDRCQEVICMLHIESKFVSVHDKTIPYKLCQSCRESW